MDYLLHKILRELAFLVWLLDDPRCAIMYEKWADRLDRYMASRGI